VSHDAEGNEFKCGEIYHVNIFAVRPEWRSGFSEFKGLIVGRLDFSGYTESQCSRTQKIIVPNGYELVALRVSENGRPMTWESLPVIFSANCLPDSEPLTVKYGEVFINNATISVGTLPENELRKTVDEWIREMIRLHCQPGGTIWQATRRNR
jgi:hypothetical protein